MKQLKILLLAASLSLITFSCKEPKLQLPVEEFCLFDTQLFFPIEDDTTGYRVERLVRFDKDFNGLMIYKKTWDGDFFIGDLQIGDNLKENIVKIINDNDSIQEDSLFFDGYESYVYDGPHYTFRLKKDSSTYVHLSAIRPQLPKDLLRLQRQLSLESLQRNIRKETVCTNQDSIKDYLNSLKPEHIKIVILPPPPHGANKKSSFLQ